MWICYVYLKLGAEAHSRARQARSTAAYTSRKKMVTMLAMVLSFPENSTSCREETTTQRHDSYGETHKYMEIKPELLNPTLQQNINVSIKQKHPNINGKIKSTATESRATERFSCWP